MPSRCIFYARVNGPLRNLQLCDPEEPGWVTALTSSVPNRLASCRASASTRSTGSTTKLPPQRARCTGRCWTPSRPGSRSIRIPEAHDRAQRPGRERAGAAPGATCTFDTDNHPGPSCQDVLSHWEYRQIPEAAWPLLPGVLVGLKFGLWMLSVAGLSRSPLPEHPESSPSGINGQVRVLIPLPDADFDVTEVTVPWRLLRGRLGHEVVFATERGGDGPAADPRLPTGVIFGQLRVPEPEAKARVRRGKLAGAAEFTSTQAWGHL